MKQSSPETEHTPTPWAAVHGVLDDDDEGHPRSFVRPVKSEGYQIAQTVGPNGPANAAFIVKAVNAHDALLKALKTARDALMEAVAPTGIGFDCELREIDRVLDLAGPPSPQENASE